MLRWPRSSAAGRVGIGRFTFHNREYLVAVRPLDGVLALHTMRFHDEVVEAGRPRPAASRARAPASARSRWRASWSSRCTAKFDPERLRGHLPRGGARADRAQGQGRGPDPRGARARGGARRPRPPRSRRAWGPDVPRTIWNGSLSFGLVNVPVSLTSAARDLDLHFRQLHKSDGAPIEQRRYCSKEDEEVDWEEVGARLRARRRRAGGAHRRRARDGAAAQDADDRHRGVRRRRGRRPDLLRPPLVPAAVRRERGHPARLPAAGAA